MRFTVTIKTSAELVTGFPRWAVDYEADIRCRHWYEPQSRHSPGEDWVEADEDDVEPRDLDGIWYDASNCPSFGDGGWEWHLRRKLIELAVAAAHEWIRARLERRRRRWWSYLVPQAVLEAVVRKAARIASIDIHRRIGDIIEGVNPHDYAPGDDY